MSAPDETRVLYNANCPVCRFEIDHYRKVARRDDLPVAFDDLNGPELAAWGIDADAAARRLHVRRGDEVLSGFPAFLALWSEMPRMRWLARALDRPGLRPAGGWVYDRIGAPLLYRAHRRREARGRAGEAR
jgi:predicted DCC family thiol-disulfide oxidoreductase YuxK